MIRVDLDAASVARVRVTPSPIFEVVSWLAVLATRARHPVLGDSGSAARFALRYRPVAAAATLVAACSAQRYLQLRAGRARRRPADVLAGRARRPVERRGPCPG